jgi:hypothetical protein
MTPIAETLLGLFFGNLYPFYLHLYQLLTLSTIQLNISVNTTNTALLFIFAVYLLA